MLNLSAIGNKIRPATIYGQIMSGFLVAIGIPIVLLLAITVWFQAGIERQRSVSLLNAAATNAAVLLSDYLQLHTSGLTTVSNGIEHQEQFTTPELNRQLGLTAETYEGFLTLIGAGSDGLVLGFYPERSFAGESMVPGKISIRDRPYFISAMEGRGPFISNVFQGKGFGNHVIVALSTAVRDRNNEVLGIVEGSLDLRKLAQFVSVIENLERARLYIIDRSDRVVFSSDPEVTAMAKISGDLVNPDGGLKSGSGAREDESKESVGDQLVIAIGTEPISGWRTIVTQPESMLTASSTRFSIRVLILGLCGLFLSLYLARIFSLPITVPLVRLADAVARYSVGSDRSSLASADSSPVEVDALISGFESMADRIDHALVGLLPICAACKDIRDQNGDWVQIEAYIGEKTEAEFSHSICPKCRKSLYPDI